MTPRGLGIYLDATAIFMLAILITFGLWTDSDGALSVLIVTMIWTCIRFIVISIRRVSWLLSIGCAISWLLEVVVIMCYSEVMYPEETPDLEELLGQVDLQTFWNLAICAIVFGRILDFYILKPYFPRKPRQEIAI